MLRFAEEIMLLILDDISGEFARVPEWSLRCALAGAGVDGPGAGESNRH